MSSFNTIVPQMWMLLDQKERNHIALVFNLSRTGISEVRDNTVVSDGYKYEDLHGITTEKMEEYVGSHETFPRLWELTVAKARYELNPSIILIKKTEVESEQNIVNIPKKRGRPAKKDIINNEVIHEENK